jgi:hypothetical protein
MKLFLTNSHADYDFVQTVEVVRVACEHEKHGFIRVVAIRDEDSQNQRNRYGSGNQLAELLDFTRTYSSTLVGTVIAGVQIKEVHQVFDWKTWYGRHYWKADKLPDSYFSADDIRNIMAADLWCKAHNTVSTHG